MQARYGRIEVGFLEEAPFASDLAAAATPPWSAIGHGARVLRKRLRRRFRKAGIAVRWGRWRCVPSPGV